MDIGAWLHDHGLGQYEQAFRANDLDVELLPTLTADDLRELGVASLGHRKWESGDSLQNPRTAYEIDDPAWPPPRHGRRSREWLIP